MLYYSLFHKNSFLFVNSLNFEISLVPRCLSRCDHLLLSLSISVLHCTVLYTSVHKIITTVSCPSFSLAPAPAPVNSDLGRPEQSET